MKKFIAILLAMLLCLSFAACGGNGDAEETTTAAPDETTAAEVDASVADETTEADAEETTAAEEPSSEDATEADAEETTAADAEETTAEEETEAAKKPETKAEIVAYFNDAVNSVKTDAKSVKHHYSKITTNGAGTYPGVVSGILKLLGGAEKFIGDQLAKNSKGETTYTGADIKAHFPVEGESYASKLTAADVASATCTESNGVYTITIKTVSDAKSTSIKHGQGHAPKAFNVILPGVVNDNIPGVAVSLVGLASMNYPSSTAVITVDAATGHVKTAKYALNWTINFDEVGVIIPFTTNDSYTITY